jgi:hypothetical protein
MSTFDAHFVKNGRHIIGHVRRRKRTAENLALTDAPIVDEDHAKILSEG